MFKPHCPICQKLMDIIRSPDLTRITVSLCFYCETFHYIDNRKWYCRGDLYNEEQFAKLLKLKVFW
jgi:hypothetical protein